MENPLIRVLLVEDDEDDYVIFRDYLSQIRGLDFDLHWAKNYDAALAAGRSDAHDIYMIDYRLGGRDGLTLLQEFQRIGCKAPIVILTGQGDYEIDVMAMKMGAADYLEKGRLDPNILERSIRYAVERSKALKALRESRARFRGVFLGAAIGICVVNLKGKMVETNPALRDMLGYSEAELDRLTLQDVLLPAERKENRRLYLELTSGQREYYRQEMRFVHKKGHRIWTLMTVSLLKEIRESSQFAIVMVEDISARKHAEEALRRSEKELRILSSKLLDAQEKERQLVAQELHDSIGASLAAIKYSLEKKVKDMSVGAAAPGDGISLEKLVTIVQETIRETRRISTNLRPSVLDDLGILATIRWFCREFESVYSEVTVQRSLEIQEKDVPKILKTVIYRILQEALNNVAKHSGADSVLVGLRRRDEMLELRIQDNGKGFEVGQALEAKSQMRGMGLVGMRERTELSGGAFSITSTSAGTVISALWPEGLQEAEG